MSENELAIDTAGLAEVHCCRFRFNPSTLFLVLKLLSRLMLNA